MKKEKREKKSWLFTGVVFVLLVSGIIFGAAYNNNINLLDNINDAIDQDKEDTWHVVAKINYPPAVGEVDVPPGQSGWLSFFCLDYGQNPDTVLANNATDWSSDSNARGYVDTDPFDDTDLKANDPFYFVCRCKFSDTAKNGSKWTYDRFRVNLTVGGDETISDVGVYDNSSNGDAVVSAVASDFIYINFYWDDEVDGYKINSDGSLTGITITIYEKY